MSSGVLIPGEYTFLGEQQPKNGSGDVFDSNRSECVGQSMAEKRSIRERREALNLSQTRLGELAGVSQQTVDRVERGTTKFSKHKEAILAALTAAESRLPDAPPSKPPQREGLPVKDVHSALEVLLHILCNEDIVAQEAAGVLIEVLQDPPRPPLGADRQSVIRIETQRIVERFAGKGH